MIEDTIQINLGTPEEPRQVRTVKSLSPIEHDKFVTLLMEFMDILYLSYKDMPDIDHDIATHKIPPYPNAKLVKQKLH